MKVLKEKIIQHVNEMKETTKVSYTKKLSDEYQINHLLKDYDWTRLLPDDDVGSIDSRVDPKHCG